MKKIGLLSDTHSYLDPKVFDHFAACDEVWHAGDIGDPSVADQLEEAFAFRAVYGNIDEAALRHRYPENCLFTIAGLKVLMTHIGGYPGRYTARVKKLLTEQQPQLYICGHSHILKVMPDPQRGLLHMNPGACGRHGFHKMRTLLRFTIEEGQIGNVEVIELGLRGKLDT